MELSKKMIEYLSFSSSPEISSILQPLNKHLGINYFLYVKEHNSGRRFFLTSHAAWSEHFYKNEYYEISAFEKPDVEKISGTFLWKFLPGQEVFADAKENFNIANGITIVQKNIRDNATEFYHFGVSRENENINRFFFEYMSLFESFIRYFKFKARKLISIAGERSSVIPLPTKNCLSRQLPETGQIKSFFDDLLHVCCRDIGNARFFTPKEIECLRWRIQGKTAEETAIIMGLSKRTVEVHIDNVKRKLNCYKQFELGYLLGRIGFTFD